MKILIFGGSFNPLHLGHLFIAEEARTQLSYDKVYFVPSNISSHKDDLSGMKPLDRYNMIEEAISVNKNFAIDRSDIDRGGVSYTIDTIKHFYKTYDFEGKPGFIIGDDLLKDFHTWRNVDELKKLIDLVVVRRNFNIKIESQFPNFYIENTIIPLSSTEIRNRVKQGKTIKYLVPETIEIRILENGYYR